MNIIKDKSLTVFLFHDITDKPSEFVIDANIFLKKQTFIDQIKWIKKNFNIIHPDIILESDDLPAKAAIITFDDNFSGIFENGLNFLIENSIPSIVFLNMSAIELNKPILPAITFYLEKYDCKFNEYVRKINLQKPYHLSMTPDILCDYISKNDYDTLEKINDYQGMTVNSSVLKNYSQSNYVILGNHLYEHWNSISLTDEEFKEQIYLNEKALSKYSNNIRYFSFTNGQPVRCFNEREIEILNNMNYKKIFSSSGKINYSIDQLLIDRVSTREKDNMTIRILKSILRTEMY